MVDTAISTKIFGPYEFSLTAIEVKQLEREGNRRIALELNTASIVIKSVVLRIVIVVIIPTLLFIIDLQNKYYIIAEILLVAFSFTVGQFSSILLLKRFARRLTERRTVRSKKLTIEVLLHGIILNTENVTQAFNWTSIKEIAEHKDLAFIWLHSLKYIPIPKRVLLREGDYSDLISFLRAKTGNSKSLIATLVRERLNISN